MSVYLDIKSLYPHLKVNWSMLMCKICIARRLVVDSFPWCNANFVPFPSGTLVARRMQNGRIQQARLMSLRLLGLSNLVGWALKGKGIEIKVVNDVLLWRQFNVLRYFIYLRQEWIQFSVPNNNKSMIQQSGPLLSTLASVLFFPHLQTIT